MARAVNALVPPWLVLASAIWLLCWAMAQYWPASWWLDVRRVEVMSGVAGQPIRLRVDRSIVRPFSADWRVRVRRDEEDGWTVVCEALGGGDYRPGAALPASVTLDWWTRGGCKTLEPGHYFLTTTWLIERGTLWPRVVTVESNIFAIAAAP